jgi:CheY-like chemotaxis protein
MPFFLTMTMIGAGAMALRPAMRILIVEDSYMTARSLVRLVEDLGGVVVGPAHSVASAMQLLDTGGCDAAVLDINLGSETVEPVAERLDDTGRPFFFVSGYSSPKLMNPRFKARILLAKPVDPTIFRRTASQMFGS